jgi:hypothetical protein
MVDDSQTAFATQYPPYGFDIDMMKVCISQLPPSEQRGCGDGLGEMGIIGFVAVDVERAQTDARED